MAPIASVHGALISDLDQYIKEDSTTSDFARIGYIPCFAEYAKRSVLVENSLSFKKGLPAGFPNSIIGPLSWKGSDISVNDWLILLSEDDIASVEAATRYYLSKQSCNGQMLWH